MPSRGSKFHAALDRRRWARVRRQVFDRDNWRCMSCGRPGRLEAHHVKPLEKGGAPYDLANLKTLCRQCHIELHRKGKVSPERRKWRALLAEVATSVPRG